MTKAKHLHSTQPANCPVLPLALRISELWDAHTMAQELEAENKLCESTAAEIDGLRIKTEEMLSFEIARSAAGALFQIAVARYAVTLLFDQLYDEKHPQAKEAVETSKQVDRLLDSVALLLRAKTTNEEFEPIGRVIRMYADVDGETLVRPLKWLDDIPGLAKEYRRSEKASTAAV
jgi:hypothetical protein